MKKSKSVLLMVPCTNWMASGNFRHWMNLPARLCLILNLNLPDILSTDYFNRFFNILQIRWSMLFANVQWNCMAIYEQRIHIEVAYALPEKQIILSVEMDAGSTIQSAIHESGI